MLLKLFLCSFLFVGAVNASEIKKEKDSDSTASPETSEEAPSPPVIEQAKEALTISKGEISDRVIILANKVDKLFGSTRALDEYYESSLLLSQTSYVNTKGGSSYDVNTNLNLSLPNWRHTEQRISKWWAGDTEENSVTKQQFKEMNPWDFNQGISVRLSRPVAYNLHARTSRNYLTGLLVHHFYEQVSWDSDRLWEEVTSLTSDYAMTRQWLFRFLNEADWGISNRVFNSYHGPSFIYTINKTTLTSIDFRLITGVDKNYLYTDNYTMGVTYRWSVAPPFQWIFIQVNPQLSWPRTEHFTSVWTLFLTVDALFGNVK